MSTGQFRHIEEPIIKGLENPLGHKVPIEFYTRSVKDESASRIEGRPIFKNTVFIKYYISKLAIHEEVAKEQHFMEHAKQYAAFLENKKQREDGIPVGMLPGITQAEQDTLEAARVYSIERLAVVPENILMQIGPGSRGLQQRAQAYLQQSSSAQVELKAQNDRIAELEATIKAMGEKPNESSNNDPKRRGRGAAIRASNHGDRQQQQGNAPITGTA